MNIDNEVGKKVRNLRKQRGYTQEQLAELVGIDDKHISKIENGVHLPTYKTLKKLSEILKFDLQDISSVSSEASIVNMSPIYNKALKILNSAKSDKELKNYYESLRLASKLMHTEK